MIVSVISSMLLVVQVVSNLDGPMTLSAQFRGSLVFVQVVPNLYGSVYVHI